MSQSPSKKWRPRELQPGTCPTCGRPYLYRDDAGAGTLGDECGPCRRLSSGDRSVAVLARQVVDAADAPWPSVRRNWKEQGW